MKRKRSIGRTLILILLLTAGAAAVFLQTPFGKEVLASSLSSVLSRSEQLDIRIGKISGWIPAQVDISFVEIGDAEGVWFTAKDLHFRWIIQELAEKRFRLRQVGVGEIELTRFPKMGEIEKTEKPKSGFIPAEFRMDGFQVKHLKLGKAIAGVPLEYTVHSGGIVLQDTGKLSGMLTIGGDAEGAVELSAQLAGAEKRQLMLKANLEQLNNPTFGLDHLSGTGEARITAAGATARLNLQLNTENREGRISTNLQYTERKLRLGQVEFLSDDFSLEGDLELGFYKGLIEVDVKSAFTDISTNRYEISGLATVATSNQTWAVEIKDSEIRGWETIVLKLAGRLTPEQVALGGTLIEFDIGRFPYFGMSNFTGNVSGQMAVTGSLDDPQIIAGIDIRRFASAEETLDELPELDLKIEGGLLKGELFASTMLTNSTSGFLSADFSMPCTFSLSPFRYNPEPEGFDGHLNADLDLWIFNKLAILENQILEGVLTVNLTVEDLVPSGNLKLHQGHYEHYDWGIAFRDLEAELIASEEGFLFRNSSATDGRSGVLKLTGGFGPSGLEVQLELAAAKIIHRPEVEAQISGNLNLTGKVMHPTVHGTLVIDRAEILLDNLVTSKPLVLTDYDANAVTNAASIVKARQDLPFDLDVRVEMPDQIYVVASLIDSVWGGVLQIKDVPEGIAVTGKVVPKRGYVNFVGKKFRFQQVGEVLLDGSVPPEPVFSDLTAEYSRSDITARLILSGRSSRLQYRLESTPAMPEDEILSHVLFNRDTTSISAYQAYQIAAAAQQLSGDLSGPGFMYQFRQAIGIDTLEWREADVAGEASTLAAGKYITPGLYIEINSSVGKEAETGMMAEYELSRHFSVETSAGPKMRPGIGLNWKTDY